MAEITAALVKALREKSGAGMMDCKKALTECDGDLEAAADFLRAKGLSAAAKKAGRVAAQGLVGVAVGPNSGAIVEVNSETDFVARNDQFQAFVNTVAELALANDGSLEAVMASGYPGTDRTVAEELTDLIATIGENMSIRRAGGLTVESGLVASYVHNSVADNLGKIAVLVALESEAPAEKLATLGKDIAMHVAATNPQALDVESLDPALIEREKAVQIEKARESGKPDNIIEKMIEGRMRKYYEEVVLLQQVSVVDGERTIGKVVADAAGELGGEVKLSGYLRFELGEGIETGDPGDFAEEVRKAAGL